MTNETEQLENVVKQARVGTIIPICKTFEMSLDPLKFFAKISDYGRKPNSMILESAENVEKYGEQSIGTADPCLKLVGNKEDFKISALNSTGERFLRFLKGDFDFCDSVHYSDSRIEGKLKPKRGQVSESERLKLKNHMDIVRTLAFKFSPTSKPAKMYGGLIGMFSYDFIDQFEDLPENESDLLQEPDYKIYFADNLFIYNHKERKLQFVANALVTDEDKDNAYKSALEKIVTYEHALMRDVPEHTKFVPKKGKITSDVSKEEFVKTVEKLKEHIKAGDIFQAVLSRTIVADYNAEPMDIYRELKKLNPSPYMYYINNGSSTLIGATPERAVGVSVENGGKKVEICPIAGTKPRGIIDGKIDKDLDSRYESELRLDPKELAEHTMLVDLARNDVAKISIPGTRNVDVPFIVNKYSHVQHLVSHVSGLLKPDLDALHAYLASMNMGTLTGAPKVEAMKLLRVHEKSKRGIYGGSVFYLTPSGDFDSCIVIRSMLLKDEKAFLRMGAGVVYDSVPENEFDETERKAAACLRALKNAGGVIYE